MFRLKEIIHLQLLAIRCYNLQTLENKIKSLWDTKDRLILSLLSNEASPIPGFVVVPTLFITLYQQIQALVPNRIISTYNNHPLEDIAYTLPEPYIAINIQSVVPSEAEWEGDNSFLNLVETITMLLYNLPVLQEMIGKQVFEIAVLGTKRVDEDFTHYPVITYSPPTLDEIGKFAITYYSAATISNSRNKLIAFKLQHRISSHGYSSY